MHQFLNEKLFSNQHAYGKDALFLNPKSFVHRRQPFSLDKIIKSQTSVTNNHRMPAKSEKTSKAVFGLGVLSGIDIINKRKTARNKRD